MKMLATSAIAVALAITGASFSAGSALADKVVVKKETTYKTQNNRNNGVGIVVAPGLAIAPGIAVVPNYRNNNNVNCKKTVTKVDRPGNRPDTKTVKTTC
ncbi:hypothetical protein RUR49_15565 [Pseudoxanthobacter sp. M-2]|uniref:hypothetical protein n=1 Tax=Pseudoxanthobacter sp. M-2 TaxID=3078754 RepID=UPI0038FC1F47